MSRVGRKSSQGLGSGKSTESWGAEKKGRKVGTGRGGEGGEGTTAP